MGYADVSSKDVCDLLLRQSQVGAVRLVAGNGDLSAYSRKLHHATAYY